MEAIYSSETSVDYTALYAYIPVELFIITAVRTSNPNTELTSSQNSLLLSLLLLLLLLLVVVVVVVAAAAVYHHRGEKSQLTQSKALQLQETLGPCSNVEVCVC
jgi:L-asparagine transporter-like permease